MASLGYPKVPLDHSLYYVDPKLAHLFKQSTGLHDDDKLKTHILRIQAEAYEVIVVFTLARIEALT